MLFEETFERSAPVRGGTPATCASRQEPPVGDPVNPLVLLVDDDGDFRGCLASALRGAGFDPLAAGCCRTAHEAVLKRRPDAAIVDLMLPDMTGLELIHEWRVNGRMKMQDVPVIVLTGRTGQEDHAAAEVLGVADYLVKPIDFEELVSGLQRVLSEETRQAFRSPLTGLPGAVALDEEIRRRIVAETPWAMLTVNIKGMHRLNEQYGYQRGDQAIRILAAALWSSSGRQAFHVSGDTFAELMAPESLDAEAESVLAGFAMFQSQLDELAGRADPAGESESAAGDGPLALAAAGLVVDAPRSEVSLPRLRKVVAQLMRDAKRRPGSAYVKRLLH